MKSKGITFLLGDEDEQIANHLSREFASGFEALGFSTRSVVASTITSLDLLRSEIRANNTTLFISLSGLGMDMRPEDNAFHELDIPLFLMLLDHPLYYWDKVETPVGLNAVSALSQADKRFINEYSAYGRKIFSLAHAASPKSVKPWGEKDIDLFYCGSLRDCPATQRQAWSRYGENVHKRLNAILEEHLATDGASLIDAAKCVLANEVDCTQAMTLHPYYVTLDAYLRDYHRVETLRSINSASLVLAGTGWEAVLGEFTGTNVRYLGRIHPNEVRAHNARAKIVLNVINTYHESHERVFSTIADGGVPLTTTSAFYRASFGIDEIVMFDWQESNLDDTCRNLLADDDRLHETAKKGHQKFLALHTWRHRAETVLAELSELFPYK